MTTLRIHLVLSIAFLLFAQPLIARAFCFEPSVPSCATGYGNFSDEWEFNSCKREMESYRSEIDDFLECNRRQAQRFIDEAEEAREKAEAASEEAESETRKAKQANESATSDYNDAVEAFNRRAGG